MSQQALKARIRENRADIRDKMVVRNVLAKMLNEIDRDVAVLTRALRTNEAELLASQKNKPNSA